MVRDGTLEDTARSANALLDLTWTMRAAQPPLSAVITICCLRLTTAQRGRLLEMLDKQPAWGRCRHHSRGSRHGLLDTAQFLTWFS
jgi:hypothetical protein